ncbi:hypothetical protein A1351_16820 [Methylosinus sp. R-45379]|uniref:DUF262 domain-containing protein n=1 Tax=Methylosinus sp. R-45379 TaxID=980563 RepID=UPI0007C98C11|nr:DUF262 domain-containing protein [Methylosinus sp. R-45379]OAI25212.1 hypothetical protein A1351_16820 [Methylosinus sp. R-45379]
MNDDENRWFDDYVEESDDLQIDEYDITASPSDFNVSTLFNFVESGAVRIPGFQRNFVWDKARSSKLIESLILGIPVPQLFLYEQTRNRFLVIDGQQRLMSIYYFVKRRFPKRDKRSELRTIFDSEGRIPDHILHSDEFFEDFNLKLSERLPNRINKFNKLNYSTLGDYKTQLDLRPIRNIVVKQNSPEGDDSSIYEVFNRLNTGGMNLRPQEIRTSMYHSRFYDMLYRLNLNSRWREFLNTQVPDLHMKDIEILLRGFAMLISYESYVPSMVRFLNKFSRDSAKNSSDENGYLEELFCSFLNACVDLPQDAFINLRSNRFNIALFEAVFTATCADAYADRRLLGGRVSPAELSALIGDSEFGRASLEGTTKKLNVDVRLKRASELLSKL